MGIFKILTFAVLFLTAVSSAQASLRQEVVQGPLLGKVIGVYDGDTIQVRLHLWIGQEMETSVRIAGMDAPEMHGKCPLERAKATAAREELIRLLNTGDVSISGVRLEKYAGRVLAHVQTSDGVDISKYMIEKGLARPYFGKKRQPWCG